MASAAHDLGRHARDSRGTNLLAAAARRRWTLVGVPLVTPPSITSIRFSSNVEAPVVYIVQFVMVSSSFHAADQSLV